MVLPLADDAGFVVASKQTVGCNNCSATLLQPFNRSILQSGSRRSHHAGNSGVGGRFAGDPLKIYNYVHDHIRYVLYFGSKKGAELTLLEKSGNDFDQWALLVALLRAAGYNNAAYQFGWMGVPYDDHGWEPPRHSPLVAIEVSTTPTGLTPPII